jgi:uncharacterized membrane-anchored protein YitT (DUF2179 family)
MKKKTKQSEQIATQETYNVWKQYNTFIRNLYHKPIRKPTGRELTLRFLFKLVIVLMGSLFTTLTFYFLIDPNGIYNSGLNGFLQSLSKLIVGRSSVGWNNYYLIYYGLGLLANLLFIFSLWFFFNAKLEIISTSIFYVLSQIIWTQLFKFLKLREYVFNRFNPSSWQGLSAQSQLSFTLPYYIVIAIVAAIVHTYGYSLIFQAQATPGGLEILTSHFSSQKKSKISIGALTKIFGIVIILVVTVFNFLWVEDSPEMKRSILQREIQEEEKLASNKGEEIVDVIEKWKKNMKHANELEENKNLKESSKIRAKNNPITVLFANNVNEAKIEKYPQEIDYYLLSNREKISALDSEIKVLETQINKNPGTEVLKEKLQRKNNLTKRSEKLKRETNRNSFIKYLSYISNNERLWATMVYIFLSSFLISQIFPRDQMILLSLQSIGEEGRDKALKLLEKFSPVYHIVYQKKRGKQEETVFVINCRLSKWNHYLLKPHLEEIGVKHVHESS